MGFGVVHTQSHQTKYSQSPMNFTRAPAMKNGIPKPKGLIEI